MSPRDCHLCCVVGGRAERMWVSAFVFCLFSAGRVRRFSVGCIIVSWERVLVFLFFALWRMVVLFRRMLLVTVSLSVFASGVVFGQGSDGGNDWLVFVFLSSLFWGFFFSPSVVVVTSGWVPSPSGLDILFDSSLRGFFRPWSVTPIHGLLPMKWIFSVAVGQWDIS